MFQIGIGVKSYCNDFQSILGTDFLGGGGGAVSGKNYTPHDFFTPPSEIMKSVLVQFLFCHNNFILFIQYLAMPSNIFN